MCHNVGKAQGTVNLKGVPGGGGGRAKKKNVFFLAQPPPQPSLETPQALYPTHLQTSHFYTVIKLTAQLFSLISFVDKGLTRSIGSNSTVNKKYFVSRMCLTFKICFYVKQIG